MSIFTYMIEWFLVLAGIVLIAFAASLIYWVWKSDRKGKND